MSVVIGQNMPIKAYICGTDLDVEMTTPEMLGNCHITPNKSYAENWECSKECGVAEVEVKFIKWIIEPTI